MERNTHKRKYANGHGFVDLGLPSGTLWATYNIGATKPEERGDYFAWGEVKPKSEYSWENYKWCDGRYDKLTKYCRQSGYGTIDGREKLEIEDDAAHVNWGGDWRMPNNTELEELRTNCIWTWKTKNGVNGYEVASKTNSNRIFLPAAGFRYGKELNNADSDGYYWSCLLYTNNSNSAYDLIFENGKIRSDYHYRRYYGQSVRPVLREKQE